MTQWFVEVGRHPELSFNIHANIHYKHVTQDRLSSIIQSALQHCHTGQPWWVLTGGAYPQCGSHICQKTFFNSGRWWPCTADSSLSATPLSPPQTCHKQIQPADNIIPAQSTLLTVLQFRVLHHNHHHHRRHLGVGQALISYEWVFKHYDSLYRNCIFQYILKEKHQKTLGCNTSIWFVATESKAFWSF